MNIKNLVAFLIMGLIFTSCIGKKKYLKAISNYEASTATVSDLEKEIKKLKADLNSCNSDVAVYKVDSKELDLRKEQIKGLETQILDLKEQRKQQYSTVGDLTVLSKSANENMKETLQQLQSKDKYIRMVQAARTKADSLNLALAFNLKSVLKDGIDDEDINVQIDKTVVFINLSDKMLYKSGSYELTDKANTVLAKIATIIKAKPNFEVMVEGYTDSIPMNRDCIVDNWDLSVKRATSVVRVLQTKHNVNPNRLIAAGRGEYNTLVANDTPENRAINRRTRIIILPKLDEFYDLLGPNALPK